jgi:hypothetical protein
MASNRAIEVLTQRAQALEQRVKRTKLEDQLTTEKVVGWASAGTASVLAGYIDGRLDLSDSVAGDGTKVMGIPVMPVAAGLLCFGGLAVGGKVGSAISFAGLGVGCGWGFGAARNEGMKAALNAANGGSEG